MTGCCLYLGYLCAISGDSLPYEIALCVSGSQVVCCLLSSTKSQSLGTAWLAEELGLISGIAVQREGSDPFFQEQTLLEACLPNCLWNKKISCLQQIAVIPGKIQQS